MQPRVSEPDFPTPWKGGGIGRAREDRFLPRHLWGAETYLHITWGCARNLACPRLISLAPPELKPLSSFSISIRSTASSEESSTRTPPYLKRMAVRFYLQKGPRQSRCCQALFSIRWKSGVIFVRHRRRILSCTQQTDSQPPRRVDRRGRTVDGSTRPSGRSEELIKEFLRYHAFESTLSEAFNLNQSRLLLCHTGSTRGTRRQSLNTLTAILNETDPKRSACKSTPQNTTTHHAPE